MRLPVVNATIPLFHPLVVQLADDINICGAPIALAAGMACDVCGCDDDHACVQGGGPDGPIPCHWAAPFLCSFCAVKGYFAYLDATGRVA